MHTLNRWILLLLLTPVFAFSQTMLDSNHYLIFNYNYPPDSLFVDGKLVQYVTQNMRYRVAEKGTYRMRAVLKGAHTIENEVTFGKSRFTSVKLRFSPNKNFSTPEKITPYDVLPTRAFFSAPGLLTKTFTSFWGVGNIGAVGAGLYFGIIDNNFAEKKQFPILVSGMVQHVYNLFRLYARFDEKGGFRHPGYANGNGAGVFATYSVVDLSKTMFSEFTVLDVDRNFGAVLKRYRQTTVTGIESEFAVFSAGFEKHLSQDFSLNTTISYRPVTVKMSVQDTVKYNSIVIPNAESVESSHNFFMTSLTLDYRFLRIFNQEWLFSFGGFWGSSLDLKKDYRVKLLSAFEFYEDVSINYSYKMGGILYGLKLLTPLTKRLNFTFNYSKINSINAELNTNKKTVTADIWQSGLRYEFR